jgi:nucleoid-associated protein YgaU
MRRILLSPNSRYEKTPLYTLDAKNINKGTGAISFFGTFVAPIIEKSDSDTFITIQSKDNGRLDYLAYLYYGTPELWWVIAIANDIFDPAYGLRPGTVIRIPENPSVWKSQAEGI